MVFDVETPGYAHHNGGGNELNNWSLRVLRADMERVFPGALPRYPCVLRSGDPMLRLLTRYVERTAPLLPTLEPNAAAAGIHIIELLAAAMGGSRDVMALAE